MEVLVYLFVYLLIGILVFSLLYFCVQLSVDNLVPMPFKPKARAILLCLLCLIAILCLLGSIGLWDAPWAFSRHPRW
jgi:hypothetical protein